MPDPRVTKLAQVLVHHSLALKPGQEFVCMTNSLADELNIAVYKEALLAGAHPLLINQLPEATEFFFKYANEDQLKHISPTQRLFLDKYDAFLRIGAPHNTRALSNIDPKKQSIAAKARSELMNMMMQKSAAGEFKGCITYFPTNASAQDADMSLSDYEDFVYKAGMLELDDPVSAWKELGTKQQKLVDWFAGKDQVHLKGENIDLQLSIKDRVFINCAGDSNFPDGEIFTGPVENSVDGWVRFGYPAIYRGREVLDIELWFEDGKIVKEQAKKGTEVLTATLDTDEGARYLGEWGIGTNYEIQQFTKNMLFDEKIGGTIHLAVGASYPESKGQNKSAIHWDMLCDMADSEITVDGEVIYKNGHFALD